MGRRNGIALNDKTVAGLPIPQTGYSLVYDKDVPGFGVRVQPSGVKSYILNFQINGRNRRYTVGAANELKCTDARRQALDLKAQIRLGNDPLQDNQDRREAPTVGRLCDEYELKFLPRLRKSSGKPYGRALVQIRKGLKHQKVGDLTHGQVAEFHNEMASTPAMANLTASVLSRMLTLAVKWGWAQTNVARGIERFPETKRQRYLTPTELGTLLRVLASLKDQQAANVFRLLLLTGCRKSEALSMEWAHVDLATGVWTKPPELTKSGRGQRLPLSAAAVALLNGLPKTNSRWVFPGRAGHRKTVQGAWAEVMRAAGFADLRVHDLRHSHASLLASAGVPIQTISTLLGHATISTTMRYSHLYDDALRNAAELVAGRVAI